MDLDFEEYIEAAATGLAATNSQKHSGVAGNASLAVSVTVTLK